MLENYTSMFRFLVLRILYAQFDTVFMVINNFDMQNCNRSLFKTVIMLILVCTMIYRYAYMVCTSFIKVHVLCPSIFFP